MLTLLNNTVSPDNYHYVAVVLFLLIFSMFSGSIYSVLTSTVSNLADKKRLGTAWGVVGTAIGLGESISPIINGLL
jgi:MFS family permease